MERAAANPRIDSASVRAQLRRVLASEEFAGSERISRFLQLAVTEALAGHAGELKEYRIGVDVFDRSDSFNPAIDPIVRVEARRLRAKLARYYEGEGRNDDIVIDLPKGGYVPAFRQRDIRHASSSGPVRLAVMPFVDLTGSADGAYLADGLTWELIHGLTRVQDLAVVAWNSAAQLRADRQPDIALIREKLQAQAILVGSVRRFGDLLCVVAQFIDAESGVYRWSERYERSMDRAADIHRDISDAIVATLRLRLGANEPAKSAAAYNPQAYQLYLRGRGQWNERTEAGLRGALESFRAAAELDANCAAAYAGMADCQALLGEYGIEPPSRMMAQAKASAVRALEIDPSLGEAHCSLGFLTALWEWNWTAAEAHYRRALDLNPGYATAHHWLACDFLAVHGRFDEALREIEIARTLDPLSAIIAEGKAFLYMVQRQYEEAEALLKAVPDPNGTFYKPRSALGRVYIQQGRYSEAVDSLESARSTAGELPTVIGALAQAYALGGRTERAIELLDRLETMRHDSYAPATALALANLGLGRRDESIRWLAAAMDSRETSVALLAVHPAYDTLRDHPGFGALVQRLGLPGRRQALGSG